MSLYKCKLCGAAYSELPEEGCTAPGCKNRDPAQFDVIEEPRPDPQPVTNPQPEPAPTQKATKGITFWIILIIILLLLILALVNENNPLFSEWFDAATVYMPSLSGVPSF